MEENISREERKLILAVLRSTSGILEQMRRSLYTPQLAEYVDHLRAQGNGQSALLELPPPDSKSFAESPQLKPEILQASKELPS
jgi:hypothetical protein